MASVDLFIYCFEGGSVEYCAKIIWFMHFKLNEDLNIYIIIL